MIEERTSVGLLFLTLALAVAGVPAQTPRPEFSWTTFESTTEERPEFRLVPSSRVSPSLQGALVPQVVLGRGTPGRLTRWTNVSLLNSFIGDANIFEDGSGRVGIGTTSPTSLFTVQGLIETKLGGIKFPDGTVQATAAVSPGQSVKSLNGLTGDVTLTAGTNVAISSSANTITVAVPNALSAVAHDATLTGDGTSANPLSVMQSGASVEPVSITVQFTVPDGLGGEGASLLTVPVGKRLVVEHGSGFCGVRQGQFISRFELSAVGNSVAKPTQLLIPTLVGSDPILGNIYAGSSPVKMYADSGFAVQVTAWRGTVATGTFSCTFHLTGFLQ